MFHPIGTQSSATYWRRRFVLLVLCVLVPVTIYALYAIVSGDGNRSAGAAPVVTRSTSPSLQPTTPSSAASASTPTSAASSAAVGSSAVVSAAGTAVTACVQSALQISAGAAAPSYALSADPVLYLQVINTGPAPCTTDLSDGQIQIIVYNGVSRVWGSHDCQVLPGTSVQTLPVATPVARSITWSGLSSQPGCGTRTHVTAGTYTVHALLGGVEGATATFNYTAS